MYKGSLNNPNKKCWLLFNNDHFDAITNVKGFVAADYFCDKCCGCFLHKDEFNKHECNASDQPKIKVIKDNKKTLPKDMAHYIKRGICKGSKEEMESKLATTKKTEEAINHEINNPRIISYDFETREDAENENRHVPNLCRAQVMVVSNDHSVEKSFVGEQKVFPGDLSERFL